MVAGLWLHCSWLTTQPASAVAIMDPLMCDKSQPWLGSSGSLAITNTLGYKLMQHEFHFETRVSSSSQMQDEAGCHLGWAYLVIDKLLPCQCGPSVSQSVPIISHHNCVPNIRSNFSAKDFQKAEKLLWPSFKYSLWGHFMVLMHLV